MDKNEMKTYAENKSAELKNVIQTKLNEISQAIAAEKTGIEEAGGGDTIEIICSSLECMRDQVNFAFDSWKENLV